MGDEKLMPWGRYYNFAKGHGIDTENYMKLWRTLNHQTYHAYQILKGLIEEYGEGNNTQIGYEIDELASSKASNLDSLNNFNAQAS